MKAFLTPAFSRIGMLSSLPLTVLQTMLPARLTTNMLVVLLIILGAIILFVTEWIPIDVTAIAIMITLIVLEPWTQITPAEGISEFSSPAAITVLAMLILSAGISQTGVAQIIGRKMDSFFESLNRLSAS